MIRQPLRELNSPVNKKIRVLDSLHVSINNMITKQTKSFQLYVNIFEVYVPGELEKKTE